MPYASVSELPLVVRSKLKGKKLRQWMHVFNSAYDRHGDESRSFAEAWATVKKAIIVGLDLAKTDKVSKNGARYTDKSQKIGQECQLCTMFMAPNGCSTVSGIILPHGWCMYFQAKPALRAKVEKAKVMSDFQFFLPIAKVDKDKRTVSGYASTPRKDSDGEIVTLDAVRNALPDYMAWGNIREMHKLSAVGVAEEANVDTRGLFLTAKIIDDSCWTKCLEGVYKGFSIGGRKLAKTGDTITEIEMTEISVVDRPANPDAKFSLAKSSKVLDGEAGYLLKARPKPTAEGKALAKMAKIVESLAKAGNPPAARDGFSLPARPDGVVSPNDSRPNENITRKAGSESTPCDAHGKINCPECVKKGGDAPGEGDKPYGNVEYADNGLQPDGKKRYPIDTEDHIRAAWNYINKPKNAAKYKGKAGQVKSKIISAWKSKIDKDGPPSASTAKMAKRELAKALGLRSDSFLSLKKRKEPALEAPLEKGMNTVGSLSYCFDSIRNAQRNLLMEAKQEGGDMKDKALAKELGSIAQQIAKVISTKAEHEGGEATDMSDADDQYLTSMLGEGFDMEKVEPTGDAIADALKGMLMKAAQPTKAMRMAMATDNMKKSRKACKAAREAIQEAHKMHKAAYLNKAAKRGNGKKPEEDEPDSQEFDHAGAMEKLQKAYQELDKARTFGKAAQTQLAKASGRSGQKGEEVSDGEGSFYEVPPGIRDLSSAALAGASPGGAEGGGQPPLYPTAGEVYPGKAHAGGDLQKFSKNGQIPAEVAELIMAKAKADGELEALRRLPAAAVSGSRRPYAFDMQKITAGNSGPSNDMLNKALFEGVDPVALGSNDEMAHTQASAKVIGNFLTSGHFGKSVFDPAFKGAAGSGR